MCRTGEALTQQQQQKALATNDNPYLEAAAEAGNGIGKLLKFVKGKWLVGDDEVKQGTEYVAYLDQLMRGWVKFEDGKPVGDPIVGKVADGFKPPKREELPDTDSTKWKEKDANGKSRDPWAPQWYLPMVAVDTGDFVTFVTGSKGGASAVATLCRIYGHKNRDGMLPIVALRTRSYKHHAYGRIETPDFQIVGWEGGAPKTTTAEIPPAIPSNGKAAVADDMNDVIPF